MKKELIERFEALGKCDPMAKKAFHLLAEASEKSAAEFLETFEGVASFNNYLSEAEAVEIARQLQNSDGSTGAKWSPETLFAKVESLGGDVELPGYFNRWALWATMNMEHSDHGPVLRKWTEGDADQYAEACYDLAVSQLEDTDRPRWVRWYFGV